jgi:AraC family transcriptional regulator
LNISGRAKLDCDEESLELGPMTRAIYVGREGKVNAWRMPGERHQFLTVEYSRDFLGRHLSGREAALHPVAQLALTAPQKAGGLGTSGKLDPAMRSRIRELISTPLEGAARSLWFNAQALAMAAEFFFISSARQQTPGSRKDKLASERVGRAAAILKRDLANPPTLSQLGAEVGCSPFYLSRTFSSQLGMTIPQFIRQVRMEQAAELLKSGRYNVTEAAMQVGYSSLSHFSQAFCEVMGCCPGLYPLGLSRVRLHPAIAQSRTQGQKGEKTTVT